VGTNRRGKPFCHRRDAAFSRSRTSQKNSQSVAPSADDLFELGKVGLPMAVIAFAYMFFVGRLFLPKNESTELTATDNTENYLAEFIITEESACGDFARNEFADKLNSIDQDK
jgi:hypothetical protein